MSEELAKKFWRDIATMQNSAAAALTPVRVKIVSDSGGEVTLIRMDDPDQEPDGATHPKLAGIQLIPDDEAYALPLGNSQLLVMGRLENSLYLYPHYYSLPVQFNDNVTILGEGGLDVTAVLVHDSLVSAGNITAQGAADFTDLRTVAQVAGSQASADTPSTTNTATMQDAISVNLTLPANLVGGAPIWTVTVMGGVNLINSAGATARVCATINGNQGNIHVTPPLNTATYTYCVAAHTATISNTGTFAMKIQYRCGTANTTTASNPSIMVVARRTG